jgi:hypothetical protein
MSVLPGEARLFQVCSKTTVHVSALDFQVMREMIWSCNGCSAGVVGVGSDEPADRRTKGGFPFSAKCCAIDFLRSLSFEIQTCSQAEQISLAVVDCTHFNAKNQSCVILHWMEIRLYCWNSVCIYYAVMT